MHKTLKTTVIGKNTAHYAKTLKTLYVGIHLHVSLTVIKTRKDL